MLSEVPFSSWIKQEYHPQVFEHLQLPFNRSTLPPRLYQRVKWLSWLEWRGYKLIGHSIYLR
jgi:hypothetical protein